MVYYRYACGHLETGQHNLVKLIIVLRTGLCMDNRSHSTLVYCSLQWSTSFFLGGGVWLFEPYKSLEEVSWEYFISGEVRRT